MFKLLTAIVTIILCCGLLTKTVSCGDLPSEIQKCPSTNNNKCIAETTTRILRLYPHGNPEFGMPDISKVTLHNIVVSKLRSNAPVQLNLKFNELNIKGLENSTIQSASGLTKDFKEKFEFDVFIPELQLTGQHEIDGKILILSLNGKGNSNIVLKDCQTKLVGRVELEKRGEKRYAVIKKMRAHMEPKSLIANMENLVQGSPELTATINQVINENWQDIWIELRDGISSAITKVCKTCIASIINDLSVDDFYSD